jgi:hypothetical protein
MNMSRRHRWLGTWISALGVGALFQQGCAIDPDLILQASIQLFTETAIFFTDNALRGLGIA